MLFNLELFHPVKDHWLGVASFPLCFLGGTGDVPHFPRPHWSFDVHLCGERCPLLADDVEIYFVGAESTVLMLFPLFVIYIFVDFMWKSYSLKARTRRF